MLQDPEIHAMSQTLDALKDLNNWERKRVLDWIKSRLGLDREFLPKPVTIEVKPPPPAEEEPAAPAPPVNTEEIDNTPPQEPEEIVEPVEPKIEEPTPAPVPRKRAPNAAKPGPKKSLKKYESVEALLNNAEIKKINHKILLTAAFIMEKENLEEITSYSINSRLKAIGMGVSNITNSINGLLNKKNELMQITRKHGDSKQSKRLLVVTAEGFKLARSLLK
ncbi:MAG: hypothetical protein GY757_06355 [bacterium]|nr:hypothetical protein [bacterium]